MGHHRSVTGFYKGFNRHSGNNPDIAELQPNGSDVIDTAAIAGILITGGTQIAAHSIAWIQSGADTIVYANSTGVAENQATADMTVTLKSITASVLTGSDFIHQ